MKISAQDEYGIRILLRLARLDGEGMSIQQLSDAEGLSGPYVAKLTRALRLAGFIENKRGEGYILSTPSDKIFVKDVFKSLGGNLFDEKFCGNHTGAMRFCTNSIDCSVRSLWKMIQFTIDHLLDDVTLADLTGNEIMSQSKLQDLLLKNTKATVELLEAEKASIL